MPSDIVTITDTNISKAWGNAFLYAMAPGSRLRPLCVSITGVDDNDLEETTDIRDGLDAFLASKDYSTKVTASTIFPFSYWRLKNPTRQNLYAWYLDKYLPRYRRKTKRRKKETYFERLIAFNGYDSNPDGSITPKKVNQLEHIISGWAHYKNLGTKFARSKLQASCFDPSKDHDKTPRFEFPCLQQVGFAYDGNHLTVSGYYTMQYIVERAYGNYLGLYNLGRFMAKEMGLELQRVNCFTANPILEPTKTSLRSLEAVVRQNI